ncbi:MAG: ankyrin repeat domain-containing protein [Desulfobacteraceae bacterium]|nr:ankyrin repeat domain-containing protein [Desulfobacteraceae bacterium]
MKLRPSCLPLVIILMVCLGLQACLSIGKPPLIKATETGEITEVDRLLSEGASVDDKTKSGATPLFVASANGYDAIAARLIEKGANPNAVIEGPFLHDGWTLAKGATPLMAAIAGGHDKIAAFLLQHGAQAAVSDENGYTPLMLAAAQGKPDLINACILKGADIKASTSGVSPLIAAAAGGKPETVALLLKKGADPKAKVSANFTYHDVTVFAGGNALMAAAAAGDDKSLQLLMDAGVGVNLAAKNGTTALMAAAAKGSLPSADLLIAQGADVNARTTESYTVGQHAVPKGSTALAGAAFAGHADMVQFLINNGADVNAKDDNTDIDALFLAASEGHLEVVKILIASSANVYAETKMGTAFCAAEHNGYQEVADEIDAARKKIQDKKSTKK